MSFTDGRPWTATAEDCKRQWSGGANGKYFRCGMCGHRFVTGDVVRWQFTNDLKGAGGNPLICTRCDGPDVIERWKAQCAEWNSEKWWHFKPRH